MNGVETCIYRVRKARSVLRICKDQGQRNNYVTVSMSRFMPFAGKVKKQDFEALNLKRQV